jgi:hypothetical protein
MTEATVVEPEPTPIAAESRDVDESRREKFRRRGGIFRLAAFVVTLAGIVFIVAVIFWSGFVLGASAGHHGGHGGGGGGWHHQSGMMHAGPGQ